MKTCVIIMSRLPQAGSTKTRLETHLNGHECSAFHQACLRDICRAVRSSALDAMIYYTPEMSSYESSNLSLCDNIWRINPEDYLYFKMHPQTGGDLGKRLACAAREVLAVYEAVIFLGSDMPEIEPDLLTETVRCLDTSDVVLGPSEDGGYYLLAMKKENEELFTSIPWGTSTVLKSTVQKAQGSHLGVSMLDLRADIDTWEDLIAFYHRVSTGTHKGCPMEAYQCAKALITAVSLRMPERKEINENN